ncbi:MAG: ABC transporter substrate-binding protein [Proteobacteria bacterium]|nr:ABC transporter substrate-binding protein [Pseudomonadota bacterium]
MSRRTLLPIALALAAALLVAAAPARAACVSDDTGTEICLDTPPTRVVSLYGAFTELLWELGVRDLVARTANDDTIPAVAALPSVGTGLRPDVEHLLALRPDLVVSRGGRASQEALSALRARGLRVAAFDPTDLGELDTVVARMGTLCGRGIEASALTDRLRERLAAVEARVGNPARRTRVVFEVRAEPLTVAGTGGLVDEVIRRAGGVNAVQSPKKLLLLDTEALLKLDPDVYVVQEGPMNRKPAAPADRPHAGLLRAVREHRVLVVDEELFSRPGPRVAEAVEQLSRFLYPDLWDRGTGAK